MAFWSFLTVLIIHICVFVSFCFAADPFVNYNFEVSYITASPLGVPQQVIAINGQFPGPTINVTTNNNVAVNVRNKLDENLLITWAGIQQRRSSWQDGVLGTNCPIPPKWNWTYNFQVKDQIGSFFYFPSLNFQRAAGGFGGFIINNRAIIPIPFDTPAGDITILIGDWYTRNHTALRKTLDAGKDLGMPDGVLINGKGPYRYNDTLVPDGIDYTTFDVHPGRTYRIRVHNVGISTSLNFRIQNHNLLLAESEGSYTVQQNYTSLDIHVGQSYSFLVTMDQNASSDYYVVASARFVNESVWKRVTGVAILHYSNSKGKAAGPLPEAPNDEFDKTFSMNQARSIRWNVSASGARPNPQGSFRYGSINVTDVYVLKNKPPVVINGKRRATLSGISFVNPSTPIRLADWYKVKGVYKLDFPTRPLTGPPRMGPETSLTFFFFFYLNPKMSATLAVRPNRIAAGSPFPQPPVRRLGPPAHIRKLSEKIEPWRGLIIPSRWRTLANNNKTMVVVRAGSRADDSSAPYEMSVENALKLLGVSEGASFEDILRAKNSILATCKDDKDTIAQVEAAYDMLLMRSLTQRRAGRVVNSSIRYADVKPVNSPGMGSMPRWLQATMKNPPISVETPSRGDLGIQAGVYGALMVLTYANGTSTTSAVPYAGADVPGLILAGSFGASLYFMTKRNVKLGKATIITVGGLVAGAVVGSAVENWLQVDIVPFLGLHSPAAVVSEFVLFSQFLVSLCLR